MDTNVENDKKRKQSLDGNLNVSNAVILALKAPVNANIEGSKEVKRKLKKKGEKRKQTFSLSSERGLKEKLEDMDTNIENEQKRKQSLDDNLNVSNTVILSPKSPVNANIEGSKEVRRKQKKKGEKRKHTFCSYGERDLKEKLEDMDTKIENKKKGKQSLDDNLNVSNAVILALKAPVNAIIEPASLTLQNNTGGGSCQKMKKERNHKTVENSTLAKIPKVGNLEKHDLKELEDMEINVEINKKRKQSFDENLEVSITDDLALAASVNGNIETAMQLQTTRNNIEAGSAHTKKKKKRKAAENNSPVQKLLEVYSLDEQVLKETEKEKNRKLLVDEIFDEIFGVSNSDDIALKTLVNGNIKTSLQTADKSIEEGSTQEKKRKKKKHKAVENNNPVQKMPEVGSLVEQVREEVDDMETNIVKERKRKKSVDENLDVSDIDYLSLKSLVNQSMETALQAAAENNSEWSSGRKNKRKKKKHTVVEHNSHVQRPLEDCNLGEQDARELEDVEINTEKKKKRRHVLDENMDISNADDLSLKSVVHGNIKMALQTAEKSMGGSSSWKKKRKEKKFKASENNNFAKKMVEGVNLCEQNGKELENVEISMNKEWKIKESLDENKVISKVDDLATKSPIRNIEMDMQTTENNAEGSLTQKNKRTKRKSNIGEINEPVQELLESGNLRDPDLKNIKHLEPANYEVSMGNTLILEVLESVDTDLKKNDKLAEISSIDTGREKRRKRKKKRFSCSSASTTEPAYVMQTAQNSLVGVVSVSCSDNSLSLKSELRNNRKKSKNGDKLNEARKSVGEHGIHEERNLENLQNMLHGCLESKLEIEKLAGPMNLLMAAENSSLRDVYCSDCSLMLEGKEANVQVKKVNGTFNGNGVLKVEDMSMLKTTEKNFKKEIEGELNKIQRTIQDNEFSGKPSVEEFLTYFQKEEKSYLETGSNIDCVAHILSHGKCNSSESCKGGLNTELQSVKNISIGESCVNCAYSCPAPGKGIKKKKKVDHALYDFSCNPFSKELEQKNEEVINELVQLDEFTERCHGPREVNLGESITELKREELIFSCGVCVMIGDVSVGAISEEANLLEKLPPLPESSPCSTRKKLLILDLNGLLADIVPFSPKGFKADKRIAKRSLFKRTHCDEFLKFCFERFDVGVWSSRHKKNVDSVVDFLMKDLKHRLLFCWDQSHCTDTGFKTIENKNKPIVLKELKKLWDKHDPNLPWEKGEYNESNTLLVDDSPYKALCNPPNTAIFPYSYSFQDTEDNSLGTGGDLRIYLEGLSMAEDMQKYVKEHPFGQRAITSKHPSWSFYSQVVGTKISEVQL